MSILYTDDPKKGDWQAVPALLRNLQDPDFFMDDDGRAYMFWGSSNRYPIRGEELDPKHRFPLWVHRGNFLISTKPTTAGSASARTTMSMTGTTAAIARGIDRPGLRYQQFPYDQVQQALMQLGVPPKEAAMYIEMYKAINAGVLVPLEPRSKENTTPTSIEQFVQDVFAAGFFRDTASAAE
jgi:hypothetical protein